MLITFIAFSLNTNAQLINCNPDSEGEPWWAGGLSPLTEEELNAIPKLTISPLTEEVELPTSVDNSQLPYFLPIINQIGGSCAQASGIGYVFTYEINRIRNLPANTDENIYPYLYAYNMIRWIGPSTNGSVPQEGWDIAKQNGIPDESVYDNPGGEYATLFWMSGYNKYRSGQNNRVKDYYEIKFDPDGTGFDVLIVSNKNQLLVSKKLIKTD